MELFPAIDLKGGEVVRLTQGDYDRVKVYGDDPAGVAEGFARDGARHLHVVDLDGARDGELVNEGAVREIVRRSGLRVQVGGGIRDEARIERYLALGVRRVILGTVAAEDFTFLQRMVERYGDAIAVAVDARDGKLAVRGWKESTGEDALAFCGRLDAAGVGTVIYTDIARDGGMQGTNLDVYRTLSEKVACDIIASGGICFTEDVVALRDMGVYGAIVGKALYEGALDLKELMELC